MAQECSYKSENERTVNADSPSSRLQIVGCQTRSYLRDELPVLRSNPPRCILHAHAEERSENAIGSHEIIEKLDTIICAQLRQKVLDLSGYVIPKRNAPFSISSGGVFESDMDAGWVKSVRSIYMSDAYFPDDLRIDDLKSAGTDLRLDRVKCLKSLILSDCTLRSIDLSGAEISGDVEILNCDVELTVVLDRAVIHGSIKISGCTIGRLLTFNRAKVGNDLQLEDTYVASREKNGCLCIDKLIDDDQTRIGNLILKNLHTYGTLLLGKPHCTGRIELDRLVVHGHLILDEDTRTRDAQFHDIEIIPRSEALGGNRAHEWARYRRELFVLQRAARVAGDLDASIELLRLQRRLYMRVRGWDPLRWLAWSFHDLTSDSGASWAWPIVWLFFSFIGFASSYYAFGSGMMLDITNSIALSLMNTFVPFVFAQTDFMREMSGGLLLCALTQCALSVGLISSLIVALRASQIPSDE